MPFTLEELENIANSAIDFHYARGEVFSSGVQAKPLLREMTNSKATFPGGKENITVGVKFDYTTGIQGFSHDDPVSYGNPANTKRAAYPWKEIHWGISCTLTELKKDGITIENTMDGTGESRHSERELTALANMFDEKIADMKEGSERGLNEMYWLDGSQDAKLIPGVKSFLTDTTTSGLVGGLDRAVYTKWRNRVNLAISVGATPSDQVLVNFLQSEMRQLRRFGTPKHVALCGSDFLEQLEKELRAKGNYTLEGWDKKGAIDIGMADVALKGVMFEYDPTLDDMGEDARCYFIDLKNIFPKNMEGEYMKKHTPARPPEKYVLYRAVTLTGGLISQQCNTSGVYKIV